MSGPDQIIDQALALRDAGRGTEAIAVLKRALRRQPHVPDLWQTLGTTHRVLEQSAQAIAAFETAARWSPGSVKAAHGIAQASLEAGRAATALFDRAHRLAPGDGTILLGRAAAQLAEGVGDTAIAELAGIVAANPLWLDGQAALARLRWTMGDAAGFTTDYRAALQRSPGMIALWQAYIAVLLQVERFADVPAVVAAARVAVGASPAFDLAEATAMSELGDIAAADAAFGRVAADADIAVIEQHARHLLRAGRYDAAARRVEPWLSSPDAGRLWPYAALAWRLTGDGRHAWLEGDEALVSVIDLEMSPAEIEALAERLRALHRARRDPLGQSVRGGTQTDGPLFAHEAPEIQRVRARVVEAVHRWQARLGPADPAHPTRRHLGKPFRFAGSWSVRLHGTGHHSSHVHPQGWLSSALYVAVPEARVMGEPPNGWLQLGAPPASLRLGLAPSRRIAPLPGRLVLFPSTMWHGTAPIDGGERLSIAFDVAPFG